MKVRMGLFAAAAAIAVAAPAAARDGAPYVGVDAGILLLQDGDYEYQGLTGTTDGEIRVDHKRGIDADIVAGYDFGMLRAEAELGFKRARIDDTTVATNFGPALGDGGKARTVSAMANLLLDFGSDTGLNGFVGGGAGVARTTYDIDAVSLGGTDNNLAWQLLAGIRTPISENIDVGLKYRFFRTKFNVEESGSEEVYGKWKSHSLLASLIFNFGAPAVAPPPPVVVDTPPPPPPPATQTCPDGSVILATDSCPLPPPPPPPPPVTPERG